MRCKNDGWLNNDNCYRDCDCHLDPRNQTQAGPLMVRHVIDGHEILLPAGAKLYARWDHGDEIGPIDLGGCY